MNDFATELSGGNFIKELLIRGVANQQECLALNRIPAHERNKMRHDIIKEHKQRGDWCGCWTCTWNHPMRHGLSHGGKCPCRRCENKY
jgi:hypothetical protein